MSEQAKIDVQAAFDPELRQAQADMNLYAENRPYQDTRGNVHDPDGGVIKPDNYFDEQRAIHEQASQTPYEEMSMPDLARKLAEAEHYGDRTSEANISDVLNDKMAAQEEKILSQRDSEHNDLRSDQLWDRVMKVKDAEAERLKTEEPKQADEANEADAQAQEPDETTVEETEPVQRAEDESFADVNWGVAEAEAEVADQSPAPESSNDTYSNHDGVFIAPPTEGSTEQTEPGEEAATRHEITDDEWDSWFEFDDDNQPPEPIMETEASDEVGHVLMQERPRQLMNWAGQKLGRLRKAVAARLKNGADQAKDLSAGALVAAQNSLVRLQEYYTDEEKGRRRRIIGVTAGAVAVGAVLGAKYYLAYKGLTTGSSGSGGELAPTGKGQRELDLDGVKKAVHSVHPADMLPDKTTLKAGEAGDNPWEIAEQQLKLRGNAHPSVAEIQAYDKQMARLNPDVYNYYGKSAEEIPNGTVLKLPE